MISDAVADPASPIENTDVTLTVTVIAYGTVTGVDFYYSVDGAAYEVVVGTDNEDDTWSGVVPGQAADATVTWYVVATEDNAGSSVYPVAAPMFTESFIFLEEPPEPPEPVPADKLLFSEISVAGIEFVEIYNPNDYDVELELVYLTDAIYNNGDGGYWRITEGNPDQESIGGGEYSDFHCRFPDDSAIAAGDTIVVSFGGSDAFYEYFDYNPHYELFEDGQWPDYVVDMEPIFDTDIGNSILGDPNWPPTLTNDHEVIILYQWDGISDLVTDLDVFFWGDADVQTFSKNGIEIDGIDPDTELSQYGPETLEADLDLFSTVPEFPNGYTRLDYTEGAQTQVDGNGVDGRDELSENWTATFAIQPYSPARPPETDMALKLFLSEVAVTDGAPEFIEIFNYSSVEVPLEYYYLTDAVDASAGIAYWRIVESALAQDTVGGGANADFHCRFPAGAVLSPGKVITVALTGSDDYLATHGELPDFELYEDGAAADEIPDMMPVFDTDDGNSIYNPARKGDGTIPALSDDGESLVLYYWDGENDVVIDVDILLWGDGTDYLFTKRDIEIDGPDEGSETTLYFPETLVADQRPFVAAPDTGLSITRVDFLEATQSAGAGNGVGHRDELSENFVTAYVPAVSSPGELPAGPDREWPARLLLSEVCVAGLEFIEICNPGNQAVELHDYYLTDAFFSNDDTQQYYWHIVQPDPAQNTVGGGDYYDFHARFPEGSSIAAGDTIVVVTTGAAGFASQYGVLPDFELYEDDNEPDEVPDMEWVFGDASGNSIVDNTPPTLTNDGEVLILYYWDGESDLVTDIDAFQWGDFSLDWSKTDVSMDGPDEDSLESTYQPELGSISSFREVSSPGQSYTRIAFTPETIGQIPIFGNGVNYTDETSEPLLDTWILADVSPPEPPEGLVTLDVPAATFLPTGSNTFEITLTTRGGSETRVRIMDLEGRVVTTLVDSRFGGFISTEEDRPTVLEWDGRNSEFERVKAGVYVIHVVSVDPDTGDQTVKTAPVVVATRLNR